MYPLEKPVPETKFVALVRKAIHRPSALIDAPADLAGVDASLREMLGEAPPPAPVPDENFILV